MGCDLVMENLTMMTMMVTMNSNILSLGSLGSKHLMDLVELVISSLVVRMSYHSLVCSQNHKHHSYSTCLVGMLSILRHCM
jgi:hypothetical protein